jgi:hypothetical protein
MLLKVRIASRLMASASVDSLPPAVEKWRLLEWLLLLLLLHDWLRLLHAWLLLDCANRGAIERLRNWLLLDCATRDANGLLRDWLLFDWISLG